MSEQQSQGAAPAAGPKVMIGVIALVIVAVVVAAGVYATQMGRNKIKIKNRAKQRIEVKAAVGDQTWEAKLADEEDLKISFKVSQPGRLKLDVKFEDGRTTTSEYGRFAPDAATDGSIRIKKKEIREEFDNQ